MPVLITNPTGTTAGQVKSSARSQFETSNPGAVKSTSVAAKATGGKAADKSLRGGSRITAAAQESNTSASGDLERVNSPIRRSARERVFTGIARGPGTYAS